MVPAFKGDGKMVKQAEQIVAKAGLPEGLVGADTLTKEERERIVREYAMKQKELFEKRLADRVKHFEEKLKDRASKDRALIIKRLMLLSVKAEIKDRKATMKVIRAEIKEIKNLSRKAKKGQDVTAQVVGASVVQS